MFNKLLETSFLNNNGNIRNDAGNIEKVEPGIHLFVYHN